MQEAKFGSLATVCRQLKGTIYQVYDPNKTLHEYQKEQKGHLSESIRIKHQADINNTLKQKLTV